MKKISQQNTPYIPIILIIVSIIALTTVIFRTSAGKDKTCGKWLFLFDAKTRADNMEDAVGVLRNVLKNEERYKEFDYPADEALILKKFNLLPFRRELEVIEPDGKKVKKPVYDMLIAYAVSPEGYIYKYNMCRII